MNKNYFIKILFIFLALLASNLYAQKIATNIPDSSKIRQSLVDSWFTRDLYQLRQLIPQEFVNEIGIKFQVRTEDLDDSVAVIVAPSEIINMEVYSAEGVSQQELEIFPADLSGSWILFRDKTFGDPLSIRYYFSPDSEIYIQFKIINSKVFADFIIFDAYVRKNVPLGIDINWLYTASFSDVVKITEKTIPWEYCEIYTYMYGSTLVMIQEIQKNLSKLRFEADIACDENGESVYISSGKPRIPDSLETEEQKALLPLDSMGFVKWVVDGLISPIAGSNLKLSPLLEKTVKTKVGSRNNTMETEYDLYYALDWIRNLSTAASSVSSGYNKKYPNAGTDVLLEPFSSFVSSEVSMVPYLKNVGYLGESLKTVFYVLGVENPGWFYLGAIRESDGKTPETFYYKDCVVFFPYFDEEGHFDVGVFENNQETSIQDFMERNKTKYINLVRVMSSEKYYPFQ